MTGQSKINMR